GPEVADPRRYPRCPGGESGAVATIAAPERRTPRPRRRTPPRRTTGRGAARRLLGSDRSTHPAPDPDRGRQGSRPDVRSRPEPGFPDAPQRGGRAAPAARLDGDAGRRPEGGEEGARGHPE